MPDNNKTTKVGELLKSHIALRDVIILLTFALPLAALHFDARNDIYANRTIIEEQAKDADEQQEREAEKFKEVLLEIREMRLDIRELNIDRIPEITNRMTKIETQIQQVLDKLDNRE